MIRISVFLEDHDQIRHQSNINPTHRVTQTLPRRRKLNKVVAFVNQINKLKASQCTVWRQRRTHHRHSPNAFPKLKFEQTHARMQYNNQ